MLGILLNLVVGVVLSIASTLISQALAPKPQDRQQQVRGFRGTIQTGGKVPQSFIVGTYGTPGKLEYRNTWGQSGETPNAYLTDVVSFGDLPISGFTGLYVNSEEVTVTASGHVTQGYPVAEKASGGADHLWWEFLDGTQTTANSFLTGKFGADPDRPWESDMIGRGVPYLTLTALINEAVWAGFPSYMAEVQGIPLYDPRKDTTAGGSGSHRVDDASTFEFSDNNIVIVYNILLGIGYGDQHVWGGHARQSQLPYAVWAAAMDACDEDVDLDAGGTEKRFRAGREIFLNERPADVILELLTGANARIAHAAGVYYVLVGVPDEADFTFTDADVIVTSPTTLDKLPSIDDVINGATATYLEPSQAWEAKETAPYYPAGLLAEDGGFDRPVGLDLGTTFSGTQAQRILKAAVEESRRFARHVVPLRPAFGQFRPLEAGGWTSDANGYTSKLFLLTARTEDPWGRVVFGTQEIDPADHDWDESTDEQPLSFAPMTPIYPPAQPMAGFAVSPYVFPDADGTGRRPGILLEYTGAMPDIRVVLYQVREDFGDENTVAEGEITYDRLNASAAQPIGGQWTLPDTDYELRAKFLPPDGSGRETEWSSWLSVTTPDVGFDVADLSETLRAMQQMFALRIRDLDEAIHLATSLAADQDAANYSDRLYVLNRLVLERNDISASYVRSTLLALGVDESALADSIEAVEAASGDMTAGVLTRFHAFANPTDWDANWGVQARGSVGDGFPVSASIFLQAKSTGESRVVVQASESYFVNHLGAIVGMFTGDGASFNVAYIKDLTADNITALKLDALEVLQDGTTVTQLIADNAISDIQASVVASPVNITSGSTDNSWVTVASRSITPGAGAVLVVASTYCYGRTDSSNAVGDIEVRIRRAGTQVVLQRNYYIYSPTGGPEFVQYAPNTLVYLDASPGTSSVTYDVQVRMTSGVGGHYLTAGEGSAIVATNLKK
jgi:hypothetical protein